MKTGIHSYHCPWIRNQHIASLELALTLEKESNLNNVMCYQEQVNNLELALMEIAELPSKQYKIVSIPGKYFSDGKAEGLKEAAAIASKELGRK